MTAIALSYRAINHKIKSISAPSLHGKGILAGGLVFGAALLVFYVISIDGLTKGAYLIKNYNNQISALSHQNQSLQMNLAQTDELSQIADRASAAGFEKTSGIKYVQILQNSLAEASVPR